MASDAKKQIMFNIYLIFNFVNHWTGENVCSKKAIIALNLFGSVLGAVQTIRDTF